MNPSWLKKIYDNRKFISFRIEPRTCLTDPSQLNFVPMGVFKTKQSSLYISVIYQKENALCLATYVKCDCMRFFSCKDSIFMELRDIRLNNDCIYMYLYIEFEFNSRFIQYQKIWFMHSVLPRHKKLNSISVHLNFLCNFVLQQIKLRAVSVAGPIMTPTDFVMRQCGAVITAARTGCADTALFTAAVIFS